MELVRRPGYMKLSLHDDFESLDPETSGRRRRMEWRSRDASVFETWPNDRGSSANLRGTSPTASGMPQQLSHRDDFYDPDQEIFDSHGWWVSSSVASQNRGRGTPNQRGRNTYQRGAHTNQCGSNTYQRGANTNQCGSNTYQREAHTNLCGTNFNQQRWTYVNTRERGTYANQRGTNTNQRGTNTNQRGTNTNQRGTNANQRETNVNQRGTNANQRGTNTNQRGMNTNQRGMNTIQRGTNANQRETNANQRGMNTNQRGTNANQRGTNANQRGTNANRGTNTNHRSFAYLRGSQRVVNTNQRGTMATLPRNPNKQRGTQTSPRQENQRGLPTSSGRSSSRLPAARGGLSLNRRGESTRGRTSSSQRGTNVDRGRSSLERTPGRLRESSPQITNLPREKLGPIQPRQPKVEEERSWSRLPWRTSLSDSALSPAKANSDHQLGTPKAQRGSPADRLGSPVDQRRASVGQHGSPVDQRRAPVDQRGTPVDRSGSPVDRRGTTVDHRGSPEGQRGSPVDQRRAPVDQRGTPVDRSGSPVDRSGSPVDRRGTTVDHRGSPEGQRGSPVDQRRAPVDQRGSPVDQRRAPVDQRGTPVDRSGSPVDRRGTTVDHRGSPEGQRGSPVDQRRASVDQRGSPVDRSGSPVDRRGTTVDHRGSPEGQRGSPVDQRRAPVDQRGTPVDRSGSPVDRRGTTVDHRGSPEGQRGSLVDRHRSSVDQRGSLVNKRGLAVDQPEMSEQPRLSGANAKSLSGRLRDLSPPKVKYDKPLSPTSWLKKLVWRWRSKISAARIKAKINVKKDESTAGKDGETAEGPLNTWSKEMIQYEDEYKAETDAKGLDPDSLMFRDGIRTIDMVLTYKRDVKSDGQITETELTRRRHRSIYQANLKKEGLELELEHESLSFSGKIWFLKVHIPRATQMRIASIIGLKLPTKRLIPISVKTLTDQRIAQYEKRWSVKLRQYLHKIFDLNLIQPEPNFYMTNNNNSYRREEQFLIKERHSKFSPAQRSLLVKQILIRAKYDDKTNEFGINRLLAGETYNECFPLHEGEYYKSKPDGTYTDRQLLYQEWARASKCYKRQPLWLVHRYFGDQIGLYYAWLGFYTRMLIPPAIVGSLCFLYGIVSEKYFENIPSKEICDSNGVGNITLCPLCDKACSYQKMYEACIFAQLTYYIDNPATVFFAIFMSIWATTFLVLWKREEAVFRWQWDLTGTDPDENPRPEYKAAVSATRINPVTGSKEPYRSSWQTFKRRVAVSSVVFLMIAVSIATVLAVITYRIAMVAVIYRGSGGILRQYARLFTICTAAVINLAVSEILIKIFTEVALIITNLENPRTQTDYEDSVTFKLFIFEFINFYATIVYIAFFKGSFFVHPGDKEARQSAFLTIKGDVCFQAGCLSELSIMLGISIIGKQTCHNIKEMGLPVFLNWWRTISHRSQTLDLSKPNMAWEQDYHLQDPGHMSLYEEYLEMIMQYGFVTLFVAAFPLGPLCALINNIFEIRMDAFKMVTQARRPLLERVEDIGAWYGLLRFLTYLAVVSNAFVIAYTSDFIPRIVYKYVYSPKGSMEGYVNYSLSWFNTSDFLSDWGSDDSEWDPPMCAYRGYRNPPNHPNPYGLSPYYWHVFAARLTFVVVFEHLVFVLTEVIHAVVPKVPGELLRQIKRERILEKELKYENNEKPNDDVDFIKAMAEGKGLKMVSSGAGVIIDWKDDEASKKGEI